MGTELYCSYFVLFLDERVKRWFVAPDKRGSRAGKRLFQTLSNDARLKLSVSRSSVMAVAARQRLFESAQPRPAPPAPRLAGSADQARASQVHTQQEMLEAAFTGRHEHPRLRAVTLSLLVLASTGLWAAIIAAAVYVGRMVAS
jgi:hypothetical protein